MKKLKELRKSRDITQAELATSLGIAFQSVSNYETGIREPDHKTLIQIANYFNVSVDYLLGNENTIFSNNDYAEGVRQEDMMLLTRDEIDVVEAYRNLGIKKGAAIQKTIPLYIKALAELP